MPQLIFLALLAVGGYYAVKVVRREMARVDREVKKARDDETAKPETTLEQDPETGRYRPKQD
ncbi:MAG TPA: hypothetical protein VKN63_00610 [Afifellaceae bacterium]|jgi:hypothetical protein|nr:hypothetical protein [Afifellaceae bacterium]